MMVAFVQMESQAAPMAEVLSLINCVSFMRFSEAIRTENMALKKDTVFSRSEIKEFGSENDYFDYFGKTKGYSLSVEEFSSN